MDNLRSELGAKIRLFSEDPSLPSPAKKQCIKAVTIDTLANIASLSPASKLFQKQVMTINGINQFASPTKNSMVTQLATNFAFPPTVPKHLRSRPEMGHMGHSSEAKATVYSSPPLAAKSVSKQFTYFSPSAESKKDLWKSIPFIIHPSEPHAIQSLGPTARVVKTPTANSFDASCEYGCNIPSCGIKMRLSVFRHGSAAIQSLGTHIHPLRTWEVALTHSSSDEGKKEKNTLVPGKSGIGLLYLR